MEQYQQRVIEERNALQEKLTKLKAFFESEQFHKLNSQNRRLLKRQSKAMTEYLKVLQLRIAIF